MNELKKKTIVSTFSLFFQSGYSAFLGLIANLVLTIILSPKIFGIYITLLSTIAFLNYFSDIGLAASLIQKRKINEDDIKSVFTFQQILIISLITLGFIFSPLIVDFYHLPKEGLFLYYALLISFFISSLKTIPSVFLERKIAYQKIVLVQIAESTLFYLTVITLAIFQFNLWSFTIAVLLRAITGLVLIYILSPWKPKIGIKWKNLQQLISFGLPFQASSFLALFKDDLIILYLGKTIGFEGVGYIGWAKKWAEAPLRIIMDNITKVLFPLIARLQDNKKKVTQVIEKNLYYQTALILPIMILAYFLMPKLIFLIPHYQKWLSALPLFHIFVVSSFLVIYLAPFVNILNALGKVKISFNLMVFWTLTTWIFTISLTKFLKIYGFPITHLIVSSTFIIVLILTKKIISFSFLKPTKKFLISGGLMIITMFIADKIKTNNILISLILVGLIGGITYVSSLIFIFRLKIKEELEKIGSK